jgi:hypothetical protein
MLMLMTVLIVSDGLHGKALIRVVSVEPKFGHCIDIS